MEEENQNIEMVEQKPKKSGKRIIIAIIIVLLISGGVGAYFLLLKDNGNPNNKIEDKKAKETDSDVKEKIAELEADGFRIYTDKDNLSGDYEVYNPVVMNKLSGKVTKSDDKCYSAINEYVTFLNGVLKIKAFTDDNMFNRDNKYEDVLDNVKYFTVRSDCDSGPFITIFAFTNDGKIYYFNTDDGYEKEPEFNLISSNNKYDDIYIVAAESDACVSYQSNTYYLKNNEGYKMYSSDNNNVVIPSSIFENNKYHIRNVIVFDRGFYNGNKKYDEKMKYGFYYVDGEDLTYIITENNKLLDIKEDKILSENIKHLLYKNSNAICSIFNSYEFIAIDENGKQFELGKSLSLLR